MRQIVVVIHNVRSAHNVGSILRSADGFGVERVYMTGYTPYPEAELDVRLPHLRRKMTRAIQKTALGAQDTITWAFKKDINKLLRQLAEAGFLIAALEQTPTAIALNEFQAPDKIALILGNEISGVDSDLLDKTGRHLQIPMLGQKESLNVSVAAAVALYQLRYF
jgi:23S rRNA (guanosine2251-2'-O)-methyltransferase